MPNKLQKQLKTLLMKQNSLKKVKAGLKRLLVNHDCTSDLMYKIESLLPDLDEESTYLQKQINDLEQTIESTPDDTETRVTIKTKPRRKPKPKPKTKSKGQVLRELILKRTINRTVTTSSSKQALAREIERLEGILATGEYPYPSHLMEHLRLLKIHYDHKNSGFDKPPVILQGGKAGSKK